MNSCIFCEIVAGRAAAQIVDEDNHTVAFMDINPATKGHALVVPRHHRADLLALEEEELHHLISAARRLAGRALERLGADGVNLLNSTRPAAWQTVFHVHLHVIPRYQGDPLRLPWVPKPGDAAAIEEAAAALRGEE